MMVKLQAAKREIDYLANENNSLRMNNESLVDKHLIGIDQLTPRPRIREMIDENRVKLDFPKDYDNRNTEAKIVWLVERIYDPSKVKYMKKKNQLKRNSSVYMMAQDRSLQSTVSPRSELIDINQSEKPEIIVAHNETLSVDKEDQTFFIKINKMKNKYNLKVAEMN